MRMNLDLKNQKPETDGFDEVIPNGDYVVAFCKAELITTKAGGTGLKLSMKVVQGELEGKQISDFLNIKNANPKSEQISLARLRRICDLTIGKPVLVDTDELMGKRVVVKVETEERGGYDHNRIKSYNDLGSLAVPAVTPNAYVSPSPILPSRANPWD